MTCEDRDDEGEDARDDTADRPPSTIEFKQDGKVVIPGTKTAGIGLKQDGVTVCEPGGATIILKQDGEVVP